MIQRGDITIYGASKKFGIPKETLRRHVRGMVEDFRRPGRDFLLTPEEEAIVKYIGKLLQTKLSFKKARFRSSSTGKSKY